MAKFSSASATKRARLARLRDGRLGALEAKIPKRRVGSHQTRGAHDGRPGRDTLGGVLRGGRVTRGLGAVVLLGIAGLGVRGFFGQKLDIASQIERAARAKYIPQLEKQLGQKVEVGEFSTDLLGRVTVENVVIGRNASLPTGALIRAKSLTLGLDIVGLALGRVKPLDAVNRVQIQSPQVYLVREPNGKFNLQSLLPAKKKGDPKTYWTGNVVVNDGRVFYVDRLLPSHSGRKLKVDLTGVEATVQSDGKNPYQGQWTVARAQLPDGSLARDISGEGALLPDPNRGWLNAKFPALPATVLGDYGLPKGQAIVQRGTVSGTIRVAFEGKVITPTGEVTLRNIGGIAGTAREPRGGIAGAGAPFAFDDLNGDVRFANRAGQSDGLTARALGALWTARGSAALEGKNPLFDVQVATNDLPVSRFQTWAKPGSIPINWQSGAVGLSAHLSGALDDARATGAVAAPDVRVISSGIKHARFDAATPQLSAAFVAAYRKDEPLKFAVRAQMPRLSGAGQAREIEGTGALGDVEITARGGSGPKSPLEISARAARWNATSSRYGQVNGRALNLVASTDALGTPAFQGRLSAREIDTNGINKGAISPDAARLVREVGQADLNVTFADVGADFKRARATADVDLARVAIARTALPVEFRESVPASALTLNNLRARIGVRNGQIVVPGASASGGFGGLRIAGGGALASGKVASGGFAVELPDIRLSAAQINPFLRARGVAVAGDWRGKIAVAGADAQSFDATFALQSPSVDVRDRRTGAGGVRLDGPSIRGKINVKAGGNYRGEAVVAARQVTARGGSLGPQFAIPVQLAGARAVGLRINANFAPRQWAARLDVTRAAVPVPGAIATVEGASVLAQSEGKNVKLTRVSAGFAGGRFDGTGALQSGKITAKVLAREVEAGALQRLLAAKTLRQSRLQGRVSALLTIENGGDPRVEAQLAGGKVTVVQSGVIVPLDVAKVRLVVAGQTATVQGATLWSDGARFSGSGQIDLSGAGRAAGALPAASGRFKVDALRLADWSDRLEQLGVAGLQKQGWKQAALDGILSGDFQLIAGAAPRVAGDIELRAGTAFGSDIQRASAHVDAVQSGGGLKLAVSGLEGNLEGAPFQGGLDLDTRANTWSARLKTEDLDAGRAARLRALSARTDDKTKVSLLPIEGNLSADIDVAGVLKPGARDKQPFFVPRSGYARLVAGGVAWQGRQVGTLRANLEIDNDLATIKTLELVPEKSATGEAATPRLMASGTIPLTPDAPGLNVSFAVAEAPLQFFIDAARDTRDALAGTGVTQTALDEVVGYADALPPGTRGDIALKAAVGGTLRSPTLTVPTLTLRDGRTPLPYGGFSPPATFDAAFSYGNGIATISKGEFRLEKTAAQREANADDDTLLRIEPGATVDINDQIDLGADVFNANLSQLSTWVPALRDSENTPILRGELTEFSLRLSGKTRAPDVIGSIQAENLMFNSYTVDRLRVARFEVANGQFKIEPGNFTIAKGDYQSSAASGSVGWDWKRGGPVADGPINVDFPVQTSDFAALAGLFVPALSQVGADEFSGGVQVVGTLADPKLSGRVTLKSARFSLDGPGVAAPVGLKNVNGTIRFTPDERIEIDADDPLRGSLASVTAIAAPATKGKSKNKKAPKAAEPPLLLAGDWKLRGGIGLDLNAESISNPTRALASQKYDLAFSVDDAAISSPQLAGAYNGDAAITFKTGDDGKQNVRWMIAANGRRKNKQNKGGGDLVSIGSMKLRDDFASGTSALLRSTALDFGTADDFADFAVAKRINLVALPDRRPQIKLDKFEWNYSGVGSGQVEGRLVLDNRDAIQQAPREAVELRNAKSQTLQEGLKKRRVSQLETRTLSAAQLRPIQLEAPAAQGAPLRVGGQLTLQNATIVGAPASGDGVVTKLSLFPDAPRFDVRLILGQKVEFVTAAFRTGLEGELVASGVPSNPQLLGTVRTRNGQVRFPNARARITEGRVTVAVTRDPTTDLLRTRVDVDASATGRAGQYVITLALNGPLDLSGNDSNLQNVRVDVSSDPPLSQSEAFAQLLGTAPRDNGDFSQSEANQAYAGAVLQVLSAPLFSGVERSVAQALGLDSVSFEYRFDEPLSVQFAKALNDRVFVTYRRSFGATADGNTAISSGRTPFELSIEYRLKGNLRLGLKTDESRITTLTLGKTFRF